MRPLLLRWVVSCCSCEVRLDVWLRGELEFCRLVAISIGEDELGISRIWGIDTGSAVGKRGRCGSSSSSSGGKSTSSLEKSSADAVAWAFLCQVKNRSSSRVRRGGNWLAALWGVLMGVLSTLGERPEGV